MARARKVAAMRRSYVAWMGTSSTLLPDVRRMVAPLDPSRSQYADSSVARDRAMTHNRAT